MLIVHSRLVFVFVLLGLVMAVQVSASLGDVSYPVAELGNCDSQEACFAYCDDSEHFDACIAFADANDLLTDEDIRKYQTAEDALAENGGPGGCTDQAACEAYCSDVSHMEECLSFASENGLMSEEELAEATQVLEAIESGVSLPGGCTSQETCEAYCSEVDHMEECLNFASAAGIMTEDEIGEAKEMMEKMQSGEMPGGCNSEETCSAYCILEENREECEAFFGEMGEAPEGVEDAYDQDQEEYTQEYQSSFVGPGGCTGEEACMSYCLDPANMDECATFFGSSTKSEAEQEDSPSEYQGNSGYEYDELYDDSYDSDDYDSESAFEGLSPEDIPLDLEDEGDHEDQDQDPTEIPDEIEVTPEMGDSSSDDGEPGDASEFSEEAGEADAGLMESVRHFLSKTVSVFSL